MSNPAAWDLFGNIALITRCADRSNATVNPDLDEAMRIMKIGESFGRTARIYTGYSAQARTRADLLSGLADVAVCALCAMQRFTQDEALTRAVLASTIAGTMDRSRIRESGPQPAIPSHEARSGPLSAANARGAWFIPANGSVSVRHTVGPCACAEGWHPAEAFASATDYPRTPLLR